jgi:hypothetical protein
VLLYAEADAADVADVLLLLNQLMIRFKEGLAPVMGVRDGLAGREADNAVTWAACQREHAQCLPACLVWGGD